MFNSKAVSKEKAKISKWQNSKTLHTFIKKIYYLIFSQNNGWNPSCHIKHCSMYQYLFSLVLYVPHYRHCQNLVFDLITHRRGAKQGKLLWIHYKTKWHIYYKCTRISNVTTSSDVPFMLKFSPSNTPGQSNGLSIWCSYFLICKYTCNIL